MPEEHSLRLSLQCAFSGQELSFAFGPTSIIAAQSAIRTDDSMARDVAVVVGTHDGADAARGFGIPGFGRYLLVCHRLPLRNLAHDIADFIGKCFIFHSPYVLIRANKNIVYMPRVLVDDFSADAFFAVPIRACSSFPAASR